MLYPFIIWAVPLLLFICSVFLVQRFKSYAWRKQWLDIPNWRSSHTLPTPRGGGLVFVLLWLASLSLIASCWGDGRSGQLLAVCLPTTFGMAMLGYWEDRWGLANRWRLLGQMIFSSLGLYLLLPGPLLSGSGVTGIMIFASVWAVNLFNFMDGTDGLASVEALFVFGIGGVFFWWVPAPIMALLCWALVGAVSGFLVWNWPKAHVFMGDVGSYSLGWLIVLFVWIGYFWYHISLVPWIILYGVFWFDATVTLLRRIYHRQPWTQPHKSHAFQRLHQAGFSHRAILLGSIALNSILTLLALWILHMPQYTVVGLCLTVGLLAFVYRRIERIHPMEQICIASSS